MVLLVDIIEGGKLRALRRDRGTLNNRLFEKFGENAMHEFALIFING